jgi:hypothetical protein
MTSSWTFFKQLRGNLLWKHVNRVEYRVWKIKLLLKDETKTSRVLSNIRKLADEDIHSIADNFSLEEIDQMYSLTRTFIFLYPATADSLDRYILRCLGRIKFHKENKSGKNIRVLLRELRC